MFVPYTSIVIFTRVFTSGREHVVSRCDQATSSARYRCKTGPRVVTQATWYGRPKKRVEKHVFSNVVQKKVMPFAFKAITAAIIVDLAVPLLVVHVLGKYGMPRAPDPAPRRQQPLSCTCCCATLGCGVTLCLNSVRGKQLVSVAHLTMYAS